MAKSVMIDKDLFIDLCKFFLMGDEYADYNSISKALSSKLDAMASRERYAALLLQERRPNAGVETVNKPHFLSGSVVDLEWSAAPGRCNILEHGTRNVLGQLNMGEAYQIFEAVNAGELEPTPENCGDSYIIL